MEFSVLGIFSWFWTKVGRPVQTMWPFVQDDQDDPQTTLVLGCLVLVPDWDSLCIPVVRTVIDTRGGAKLSHLGWVNLPY